MVIDVALHYKHNNVQIDPLTVFMASIKYPDSCISLMVYPFKIGSIYWLQD